MTRSYFTESSSLQNPEEDQSFWKRCCNLSKVDGFSIASLTCYMFSFIITCLLGIYLNSGVLQVVPTGSVSSDDGICSEAGVRMIREGGSAVDATIASLLCLSVTQPQLVGPGGGGMIMVYDHKRNDTKIYDFMVKFLSKSSKTGVPGFLKGLKKVHELHGTLPWKSLFQPAIVIARNGFLVSKTLKLAVDSIFSQKFRSFHLSQRFVKEFSHKGIRISEGAPFSRPKYADFLTSLSHYENEESYIERYSMEMLKSLQSLDPLITTQELRNYEVIERNPLKKLIENVSITTAGPPFGGFQVLAGLKLVKELGISTQTHPAELYRAFSRVLHVVSSNSNFFNRTSLMMSTINPSESEAGYWSSPHGQPPLPATQVAVVDTFDVYVSAVAGLGNSFGSGLMTSHGITLNGIEDDTFWSSDGFHGRRIVSYTPVVASEPGDVCGQRVLLSSASWNDVLQTLTQMIFRKLELTPAVLEPRISLSENQREILINDFDENIKRLPTTVREALKNLNFTLSGQHHPSAVNGLSKIKDLIDQISDPRSDGRAVLVNDNAKDL